MVPQVAVMQGPNGKFVFVVSPDDTAQPKPIQVGDWYGDQWIVNSGLEPGDRGGGGRRGAPATGRTGTDSPGGATRARVGESAQRHAAQTLRGRPMISHFFIDRPVFAAVISIILTLAGLSAMGVLPIAQYPEITPVQVTVSATYPGASADVVSQSVAAPIEQQVNSVDNLMYMYSSSSSTGNMTLNVFFRHRHRSRHRPGQRAKSGESGLAAATGSGVQTGVQVQTKSSTFLMVIAIYSPDGSQDETFVGNYAYLYILNALQRIPGANQASIFGTPITPCGSG